MIKITVIVGKTAVAMRTWSSAPGIGDEIEVDGSDPRKSTLLIVQRVIWKRGADTGYASVDLICRKGSK